MSDKTKNAIALTQDHILKAGDAANEKLYGQANFHMLTAISLTIGVLHHDLMIGLSEIVEAIDDLNGE